MFAAVRHLYHADCPCTAVDWSSILCGMREMTLPLVIACVSWPCAAATMTLASYSTQGVSGNAAQWNGVGGFESTALPAVRGAGLGLAGGFNQFAATRISTSPNLVLADNDYIRFGFTLSQSAGAEHAITQFRAACGSFSAGAAGMKYQVWGFFTNQAPFALHAPLPMNAPATTTLINLTSLPGNAIVFPGQTAEFRVYFWGAAGTQNGVAFISDGNAATPDVEISGVGVPTPGSSMLVIAACGMVARRRRRGLC